MAVTVRSRHTELPLTQKGSVDWRAYLLKKVNALIANQGRPEIDNDLRDESKEFIVRLAVPVNRDLHESLGPSKTSPAKFGGSGRLSPKVGESPSPTKISTSTTVLAERDLRHMTGNDLRTFARQLKNGEVKVTAREDKMRRGGKTTRTFGEQNQDFFRTGFRGGDAEDESIREREKAWNNFHTSKRDVKWSGGKAVAREMSIGRELKRRIEEERRQQKELAMKGEAGKDLEEERERQRKKQAKAEEAARLKKMEQAKWRKMREGKKRIDDSDILDFFKVEHLVAASNDNYTSSQVKEIYRRAQEESKQYEEIEGGEVFPEDAVDKNDRTLGAITRRLSAGFALGNS